MSISKVELLYNVLSLYKLPLRTSTYPLVFDSLSLFNGSELYFFVSGCNVLVDVIFVAQLELADWRDRENRLLLNIVLVRSVSIFANLLAKLKRCLSYNVRASRSVCCITFSIVSWCDVAITQMSKDLCVWRNLIADAIELNNDCNWLNPLANVIV